MILYRLKSRAALWSNDNQKGKGVNKAPGPASHDLNLSDQGSKTEKHYHDLVALSRVSAAISGLQDLDTILKIGLDNVLNIMNGTVGGIMLLDESGQDALL